jgi:hypothetical protein
MNDSTSIMPENLYPHSHERVDSFSVLSFSYLAQVLEDSYAIIPGDTNALAMITS